MNKYLLSVFLSLSTFSLYSQSYYYYVKKIVNGRELYGYVDASGCEKIPCQYPIIYTDTLNTIAFVTNISNDLIAIDSTGKKLFNVLLYDNGPDYVCDGLFRIVDDQSGKIGYANMDGRIVISPQYTFAFPFRNGIAKVSLTGRKKKAGEYLSIIDGKWGIINLKGKFIVPCFYDDISFSDSCWVKLKTGNDSIFLYQKSH